MGGEWRETTLGEEFFVNPTRSIRKGQVTPYVTMDVLPENGRTPNRIAERESRSLAQLRDTLLPKLISGELRVPDAKTFLK